MVGIVGCGNMGAAIVKGIVSQTKKISLKVYDKDPSRLALVKKTYGVKGAATLKSLLRACDTVLVAVKPQDINTVCASIRTEYKNQLIVSIVAGVTTSFIERKVGGTLKRKVRVVRVMPNLAAHALLSVSALAKGKGATHKDMLRARRIFSSIGNCIMLEEKYIDAVTAISGSGPGYIYYFFYCLQRAARKLGFSQDIAKFLVFHTAKGAVALLEHDDEFLTLVGRVASKGGTTEAALSLMEEKNLEDIIEEAVRAAHKRAKELAQ